MYRSSRDEYQQVLDRFYLPFEGKLNAQNRWVKLAQLVPWKEFEAEYASHFSSELGPPSKPFRMALGAILIKHMKDLTDERTVEEISENPYMQFFLGLEGFVDTAPFDETMMGHFRKRISDDMLSRINEQIIENQLKAEANQQNTTAEKRKTSVHDDDQDQPSQKMLTGFEQYEPVIKQSSTRDRSRKKNTSKPQAPAQSEKLFSDGVDEPKR